MGKVLIVEDDALITKVYSARLTADGHQVFTADNGKDGLAAAIKVIPEVILLDLMMPKISGLDVLKELKKSKLTKNIPVLVYSNLAREEEVAEAKKLGAAEFLAKASFSPQQVVDKIEKFLK